MWNSVKRLLTEKSRWRHIRLSIKPRFLGNHASQLKSYYGTLWGSHGRAFRIRHEKSHEAPPGEEITMKSYLVGSKTSLSRKPCIPDEKLLIKGRYQEVMVALSESVMKICLKRPLAEKSRWRHIRLAIKPRYLASPASQITSYYGTLSGRHGRSFRIRQEKSLEAPPSG